MFSVIHFHEIDDFFLVIQIEHLHWNALIEFVFGLRKLEILGHDEPGDVVGVDNDAIVFDQRDFGLYFLANFEGA